MKTILALTIVVLVVIIALMYERIKDLKAALTNVEDNEQTVIPFDVERTTAAQLYWSNVMTDVEKTDGKEHWSYKYAEKQLAACTAALIINVNEGLDQLNEETN